MSNPTNCHTADAAAKAWTMVVPECTVVIIPFAHLNLIRQTQPNILKKVKRKKKEKKE